jgi:hypothetical protein
MACSRLGRERKSFALVSVNQYGLFLGVCNKQNSENSAVTNATQLTLLRLTHLDHTRKTLFWLRPRSNLAKPLLA